MRVPQTRREKRSAFTLIELMMVILIIAILLSLLSGAVMKFIRQGNITKNRTEIGQLESSVAAFNQAFGLDSKQGYFPSRFILCENYSDYFNASGQPQSQLHRDSLAYLQRIFPKLWKYNTNAIDWNNNGVADGPVYLEGSQCLVFFLGGIPTTAGGIPGCLGFSTSVSNPAAVGGPRKGPFYEFASGRLTLKPYNNGYFSYLDVYERVPFAYFSSNSSRNGYNRYLGTTDQNGTPITNSDCAGLGVWPYAEYIDATGATPNRYLNANKFQIISAGEDMSFGPGTDLSVIASGGTPYVWNTSTAESIAQAGRDDQANFSDSRLSVAP